MNDVIELPNLTSLGAIGQPLRRKEDERLLTGRGRFSDDFTLPGQSYAVVVRSPHPHARIVEIDTRRALAMPGISPRARLARMHMDAIDAAIDL
jgi:CO/xanthine dehydrogenase Mo-binding subunit